MELITFLITSSIYFSINYLIYKLLLGKITFFIANRIYLIGIVLFSLCFPFVEFSIPTNNTFLAVQLPELTVMNNLSELTKTVSIDFTKTIYFGISVFFLLVLVIKLGLLVFKIKRLKQNQKLDFQPFSFLNFVYIPSNFTENERQIIFSRPSKSIASITLFSAKA